MHKKRKKKKNGLNYKRVAIAIFLTIVIIFGISELVYTITHLNVDKQPENVAEVEEKIPEDSVASIVAIGDTLCHSQNFKDAYNSQTGTYDFSPMFKYVTKYFEDATVAVGNLEATLAGPSRPYTRISNI